jgi:hypothetical protein
MTERISHIYKLNVILLVGYTSSFHIIQEKQTLKFLKIFQDSWAEEYGTKKEKIFFRINYFRDIGRTTKIILREAEHRYAWARRCRLLIDLVWENQEQQESILHISSGFYGLRIEPTYKE